MQLTGMALLRTQPGLLSRIATELGISRSAVAMWERVPLNRVPDVARITGFSRRAIRPDFPWDDEMEVA
jgi:DNA-binding transcriptional regulator YdaS (Cro superfamily)